MLYRENNIIRGGAGSFCVYMLLISFLFHGSSSSANNDSLGSAKLVLEDRLLLEESLYDFGNIKPNSTNTAVFHYTNVGDILLTIKGIFKCCGVIVILDKEELAPGQSGTLTAKYTVGETPMTFNKNFGFYTNDPNDNIVTFTIKGQVNETLSWTPKSFEIPTYLKDINCPNITIKSHDDNKFFVTKFNSTFQCISADFDPNIKSKEFVLQPIVNAERLQDLAFNKGTIIVGLDHPNYKRISIKFTLTRSLQARPSQILLFNAKVNEPVIKMLQLQDNLADSSEDVSKQIESVTLESGSRVNIQKLSRAASGCNITLKIWPYYEVNTKEFITDKLIIEMKDGRQLTIPLRISYNFLSG